MYDSQDPFGRLILDESKIFKYLNDPPIDQLQGSGFKTGPMQAEPPIVPFFHLSAQTKMLTDMDKIILDSMIQNDETIETMLFIFHTKLSVAMGNEATRYLNYKKLREEIELYVNQ